MSLAIAGMGWVTPLGNGVDPVWDRLLHGDEASATAISEQFGDRSYSAFRVPESALSGLAHPRLRRASVISRFAAAAGLEALQAAGLKVDSQNAGELRSSSRSRTEASFTPNVFIAMSSRWVRSRPVPSCFRKRFLTRRQAISRQFWVLPGPLTPWLATERWGSWR